MSRFKIDIPAEKTSDRIIRELKDDGLPVVIFGAGEVANGYFSILKNAGLEVFCAVSEGFDKPEGVYSPEEIDAKLPAYNLVPGFMAVAADTTGEFTAKYEAFRNKKRVVMFKHCCSDSIVDDFTSEYFLEHYEGYKRLYDSLSDEKSRESYTAYLYGKLSDDNSRIIPLIELPAYFSGDFLHFEPGEVLVDCGAYQGDTIRDFAKIRNLHDGGDLRIRAGLQEQGKTCGIRQGFRIGCKNNPMRSV